MSLAETPPAPSRETAVEEPPRSFGGTLLKLGPGMIIAGSIVGSGELIATTKVGAEAGFWLLWLIILGCLIKVFAQVEFGRHAITWGQTPLRALDEVPGPRARVNWIVWYWAFMTVLILSQQGGIVGGVGQALAISAPMTEAGEVYTLAQEEVTAARVELAMARRLATPEVAALETRLETLAARADALPEPPDAYLWAAVAVAITVVLVWFGHYRVIQNVATAFVIAFTVVTVASMLVVQSTAWGASPGEILSGLSFRLPPDQPGLNPLATAFAAFGIIGLGAAELIQYPYWCLEKGYARATGPRSATAAWVERARGWVRVLHIDAFVSMVVYTFATVSFYMLGATVLWRVGLNPAGSNMIRTLGEMYTPVFGAWGEPVFLVGAVSVLYSTFFVSAAGNARIVADGLGMFGFHDGSEETRMRWTRVISVAWAILALVILLFIRAPVAMVLASGVAQSVMLPMLGIAVLFFRYRRLDPALRPGRLWDFLLWLSCIGFLLVGVWAVWSVIR